MPPEEVRISVRVPAKLVEEFTAMAEENHRKMSQEIRRLMERELKLQTELEIAR